MRSNRITYKIINWIHGSRNIKHIQKSNVLSHGNRLAIAGLNFVLFYDKSKSPHGSGWTRHKEADEIISGEWTACTPRRARSLLLESMRGYVSNTCTERPTPHVASLSTVTHQSHQRKIWNTQCVPFIGF